MATVTIKRQAHRTFGATVPYGNVTSLAYDLATNSSGAVVGSDAGQSAATPAGTVIVLGYLPSGMRLDDAVMTIEEGMTDDVVGKLGFIYEDGVDVDSTQDDAYFLSGVAMKTAAKVRATGTKVPFKLPKPALLVLTTSTEANAKVSKLTVVVSGVVVGNL